MREFELHPHYAHSGVHRLGLYFHAVTTRAAQRTEGGTALSGVCLRVQMFVFKEPLQVKTCNKT